MKLSFLSKEQKISVFESHSLWNLLSSKYNGIENVQLWYSYAHDPDLKKLIKDFLKDLNEHVTLLEKELAKYNIESPARPLNHPHKDAYTQVLCDEIIGKNYLIFLQRMVDLVLFSIQYSFYNDDIYTFLQKFSKHAIEQTDNILKYLKLKGWLEIPPFIKNIPKDAGEQIGNIEAFHLWAHTNYRYINIEETMRWKVFIHDIEFIKILDIGLRKLKKQVKVLESELERFCLPIPKKPPKYIKSNQDKSIFQDEYIFKSLFTGLQWAGVLHSKAFIQCVTNDRIRNIFKKYLYEEVDMLKHITKYGKLKGWLEVPPEYVE